jgi:hypothetical protein
LGSSASSSPGRFQRARAGKGIAFGVVRDEHVPDLRMHEPVHELVARHHSAADPRADRDVTKGVEAGRRAPALLTERGSVDVGVEDDRYVERRAHRADDVGVRPARLRRGGDQPAMHVDRPERSDAERGDLPVLREERGSAGDRLFRRRRRDRDDLAQVVRPRADRTDPFRSTRFDAAVRHRHENLPAFMRSWPA